MHKISKMIADTYLLRRAFVSDGLQKAIDILAKSTDIKYIDHKFKSGTTFNGWEVPKKWEVKTAKLFFEGKEIYDGMAHPLGVITHCSSYKGKISLEELKKHIFVADTQPDAIPFHFRMMYRPWESGWGFCMPKNLLEKLKPGVYEVNIDTTFEAGEMTVREFVLEGDSEDSIIFVGHIDHAGQANDDVSGCAVGIELLNKIKEKYKSRKYTYRVLLTQEIVGSVFYLSKLTAKKIKHLKYGMFLEMLGNDNSLKLQSSLAGDTYFDNVCRLALKSVDKKGRTCGFRESAGNDEIVFEAPGYNVAMPSISRWPYKEYHTSLDNMDIIKPEMLDNALNYLLEVVFILEHDAKLKRKFTGLIGLANPKYDMYVDPGQIVDKTWGKNKLESKFQYFMPSFLEGNNAISELSAKFEIEFRWLLEYFSKMKAKKLVGFKRIEL